jgi:hypothetical protein
MLWLVELSAGAWGQNGNGVITKDEFYNALGSEAESPPSRLNQLAPPLAADRGLPSKGAPLRPARSSSAAPANPGAAPPLAEPAAVEWDAWPQLAADTAVVRVLVPNPKQSPRCAWPRRPTYYMK